MMQLVMSTRVLRFTAFFLGLVLAFAQAGNGQVHHKYLPICNKEQVLESQIFCTRG